MATSPSATQARGGSDTGAQGPSPRLLAANDMAWGPAPDAFPHGCQLCLLHGDPGAEGALFSVRLRAGQGMVFPPHKHPHDEHVTVISGRLELGDGERLDPGTARIMEPGAYAFLPRDRFHSGRALSDGTTFQVEAIGPFGIAYARPEDDPRNRR